MTRGMVKSRLIYESIMGNPQPSAIKMRAYLLHNGSVKIRFITS